MESIELLVLTWNECSVDDDHDFVSALFDVDAPFSLQSVASGIVVDDPISQNEVLANMWVPGETAKDNEAAWNKLGQRIVEVSTLKKGKRANLWQHSQGAWSAPLLHQYWSWWRVSLCKGQPSDWVSNERLLPGLPAMCSCTYWHGCVSG